MPKSKNNTDGASDSSRERGHTRKNNRFKNKIAKDGYDYYAVLGFTEKSAKERSKISNKDIIKAFNKQLKKYHPDRIDKNVSSSELKQLNTMYKLVQQAGDVLGDKNKRKAYDIENSVKESAGHVNHKSKFDEFMKLQEKDDTGEQRERAKLDFERGLADLDKKHGAHKYSTTSMTKDDTNRRLEDLMQQRDIEEIEARPQKLFEEGQSFNRMTFMKAFEKDKIRRKKKRGKRGNDIIPYDDIGAFNDNGPGFGINDDYGSLYNEEKFKGNNKFGGLGNSDDEGSDSGSDLDSVDSNDIDSRYFHDNEPMDNTDVESALDKLMKQRENDDDLYANKSYDGYKSSMHDKFGVSSGMGFMVGTDFKGSQMQKKSVKQLGNDEIDAYKRLIGYDESSESEDEGNDSDDSYDIDA